MEKIELIKNGAVQIYSEQGLTEKLLSGKRLTIKLGADPSRPDLHLGHSVVLRKLKLFQALGHRIVFVIGDFTAMIGDPTGRSKTRPALTLEETRASGESYFKQVTKILDPVKTEIAYNSEWLSKMNFADVISLCSKYTVARILERNDFANRLAQNLPISMHELLYPLVQGYDSVAINADVEVGGTDQTFNLLVGRDLQAAYGQAPQEVITFPLLVGLDGKEKMSKSLENYIGIDEPADIMFEKAMKVPDNLLLDYYVLTTDTLKPDAEAIIRREIREAHLKYAFMITEMYHGRQAAENARQRYLQVAGGAVPERMPEFTVSGLEIMICDLLKQVGFSASKREACRSIAGRGVKINGVTVEDLMLKVTVREPFVLQFGKSRFIKVRAEKGDEE
ncbi:MAG TPA: tyrosine--tRNA ligase [Firmicutes bacterium]|jgi:tyrosyl-tRNA synthetase|nr:tyrosine--tRNA ligase [Bacillota bacterium]